MYVACQTAIIFLLLASVPLAAWLAAPQKGDWKAAGRGALCGVLGSLAGAVCSQLAIGLLPRPTLFAANAVTQHLALAAYLPVILAGGFEEAARFLGIWRGRQKLSYRRGHALMFGIGFGGTEMIARAAGAASLMMQDPDRLVTGVVVIAMLTGLLLAFAIYVFHICMAVIAFRIVSDERLTQRAWVLFPLMAADHAALNVGAASMFLVYPSDAYALSLWSIAAPLHVALALSAWRCTTESAPHALAAGGS